MSQAIKPDPATSQTLKQQTEVGSVFVSNYPAYSFWNDADVNNLNQLFQKPAQNQDPLGLYLHIPFCRKRCKFCYFKVYIGKNSSEIETYLAAVVEELKRYSQLSAFQNRPLRYVYFGGGTPSFISVKHLKWLVDEAKKQMDWGQIEEFAFECEPGTLTQSKIAAIKEIGVTRLSIGVEHFDDKILAENGRAHVSKEIYRVKDWVHSAGFEQVNIDLISGMIGDTWETWKDTVQKAIDYDPDSVTIYQLELPFNAIYSKDILNGNPQQIQVADWKTKREWHQYAIEAFEAAGYAVSSAYTVVKKDKPLKFVYRDALWRGSDMMAVGVSSFGHFQGVHYQNVSKWQPYLDAMQEPGLPVNRAFQTSERDRLIREMILQLKLGYLDPQYFSEKYNVAITEEFMPQFSKLQDEQMLSFDKQKITLSRQGLLQVDQLLPVFYDTQYQNARYT